MVWTCNGPDYWVILLVNTSGLFVYYLVRDDYSHRIIDFDVTDSLEAINYKEALMKALQGITEKMGKSLIHYSDRGIQADPMSNHR